MSLRTFQARSCFRNAQFTCSIAYIKPVADEIIAKARTDLESNFGAESDSDPDVARELAPLDESAKVKPETLIAAKLAEDDDWDDHRHERTVDPGTKEERRAKKRALKKETRAAKKAASKLATITKARAEAKAKRVEEDEDT